MHGLRLFSDVSARGNAAPSLLHGYASHTETDHAASRLLPLILHPDEKSGTTHNCSKIHEGNADNNSYFHDADIVSYEAQPDASQYPEYIHKILHPTSVSSISSKRRIIRYHNFKSFHLRILTVQTAPFPIIARTLHPKKYFRTFLYFSISALFYNLNDIRQFIIIKYNQKFFFNQMQNFF